MADRVDIGKRGAETDSGHIVHGQRGNACGVRVVHILARWKSLGYAGVPEGEHQRFPCLFLVPPHAHRPVVAVKVVMDVLVSLHAAEEGEELDVFPFVVALGGPRVVIFRQAAQEHLAVDGAGAADDFASGGVHVVGAVIGGLADK